MSLNNENNIFSGHLNGAKHPNKSMKIHSGLVLQ